MNKGRKIANKEITERKNRQIVWFESFHTSGKLDLKNQFSPRSRSSSTNRNVQKLLASDFLRNNNQILASQLLELFQETIKFQNTFILLTFPFDLFIYFKTKKFFFSIFLKSLSTCLFFDFLYRNFFSRFVKFTKCFFKGQFSVESGFI